MTIASSSLACLERVRHIHLNVSSVFSSGFMHEGSPLNGRHIAGCTVKDLTSRCYEIKYKLVTTTC